MLDLLKFADARLGEPSTWASIALLLATAHVSVDPGVLHQVTLWASIASGVLGVVLTEVGTKPAAQIASDAVTALLAAAKAMPVPVKTLGLLLAVGLGALLAACSAPKIIAALQSPPGQLFCAIQTSGGGTIVAGLISTAVTGVAPGAGPIAVLATNATVADVDGDCAKAAMATGGVSAVPVSPPAVPSAAPQVAIPSPASPVTGGAA
jgi:hypothetical protein